MVKKIVLSLFVASALFGADNQRDLNLINANIAYEQGITGNGINIGVIDGAAKMDHPSLAGQIQKHIYSTYNGKPYTPDYSADTHGTHVTSIIVGNNLGDNAMHGVAYDAKSYNVQISGYAEAGTKKFAQITDFFTENNVKIINNSWNANYFPLVGTEKLDYLFYDNQGYEFWFNKAYSSNPVSQELANLARNNKALVLFATGNEGIISPGLYATLRSYDESLKSFMIVGSIDSNYITMTNGKISNVAALGVSLTGNGFKYATNYGLVAPGVDVLGAYPDKDGYIKVTGTSQATPFVSGAAALVMQKFSFLEPSQVADVLLSTANRDFTYQKVALKKTDDKYTIFYINATAPSDTQQIRADLLSAGYDASTVDKALSSIHPDTEYPLVQSVKFEDVFGQGILDIGKAMGGLAILDANRLSDADVKKIDKTFTFNGRTITAEDKAAVYYTIDTQGYDAEFTNDISQRKWDENTHLQNKNPEFYDPKVTNKPTALTGLEVGLRKIGDGVLTFSGRNTYAGPTLLEKGELVFNAALTTSNLYIEKDAIGTINAAILKNESARKNDVFIGGNILNDGVFRGIGAVKGSFVNNGVLKAGFYDENIQDLLNSNDIFKVEGTFIQNSADAQIQIAFTKNQANSINSQLTAKSYSITDGSLIYIPLHSTENLLQPGEIINISIDDNLINNDKLNISVQNRNLITFKLEDDKKTIKVLTSNAPEPTDPVDPLEPVNPTPTDPINPINPPKPINPEPSPALYENTIISALQSVLSNKAASNATKSALAQLDNLAPSAFNEATKSIKDTPNSANINTIETMQKGLNIKSTLFLLDNFSGMGTLNTSSVVFAPTAAFGDEYLGKVDDIYIKTQVSAGASYRHTNHDDYKQNMYMLDIQGKKQISENSLLGGFIGFANAKTTKDYSEVRSNMFSLGLSYNHDFGSFGLLGLASVGMSFNNYDQSIKYISGSDTDAHYKNYFANFQIGAYKSFNINENSIFTPLAMIDYSVIRQDSFDQNGALAKHYDSSTTNVSRAWLGANLNHKLEFQNSWVLNTSLFAFYWHKLGNSDINQDLSFIESAGQKFASKTSGEKQGFYGGIALEAKKNNKFFRLSFSDEKTSAYNQYEIMLRAGVNF